MAAGTACIHRSPALCRVASALGRCTTACCSGRSLPLNNVRLHAFGAEPFTECDRLCSRAGRPREAGCLQQGAAAGHGKHPWRARGAQGGGYWLKAPAIEGHEGVTFGGSSVGPNGEWTPKPQASLTFIGARRCSRCRRIPPRTSRPRISRRRDER